jgi:hypothetical protein
MKLFRLIKMCLKETYGEVRIGKYLCENFPNKNYLKEGDALSPLLFNFDSENAIRKIQENQVGLKLNGTHQLLIYADNINVLGDNRDTIKKSTQNCIDCSKEAGLEVYGEKTKHKFMSCHRNARQNLYIKIAHKSF